MLSTYKPKHIEIVGFDKFNYDYNFLKADTTPPTISNLVNSTSQDLVYDANGNLVSGDGYFREYNELNQLIRIRNSSSSGIILEEYIFHPVEERVLIKNFIP